MDRTDEDEMKNSGSFLLRDTIAGPEPFENDSALNEMRPLLREDIQFDEFKPKIGHSSNVPNNQWTLERH